MKEFVIKLSCEEFGHLVLLAAFDCVDDTVLMKKALIQVGHEIFFLALILPVVEVQANDRFQTELCLRVVNRRHVVLDRREASNIDFIRARERGLP